MDRLKGEAREKYGTDDIEQLAKLQEMKNDNEKKRGEYQSELERIEGELAQVEQKFQPDESTAPRTARRESNRHIPRRARAAAAERSAPPPRSPARRTRAVRGAPFTGAAVRPVECLSRTTPQVTLALEQLSEQLFQQLLGTVQEKLTVALQEILEQPIVFKAAADFKRGAATVEFWVERDGNAEDILRGQGGSVANILSVGLRMFALATLDERRHRRFLVLDEQDCWLRPDLVPRLVKIVHQASQALAFKCS